MRALILTEPQSVSQDADWPEPALGPDDVVVAIRAVGLCGSDLSVYDGSRTVPELPWVMGHEGGGDIVAVGEQVRDREVGQRVVVEPNYPCLTCGFCRSGHTSACPVRDIVGMNVPGLLAERIAVPARFTWPVDSDTPGELLASVEPFAVARSAVKSAGIGHDDRCLVVGAGSQGLLVCLALLELGARPEVIDPHHARAELAVALGARHAENGTYYPYVFETAGAVAAAREALERAAPLATVVMIGLSPANLPLSMLDLVRRQLTVRGALIYDHPEDFTDTVSALGHGTRLSQTIGARFTPDDADAAFAQARTVVGKSWIDLSSWHDVE